MKDDGILRGARVPVTTGRSIGLEETEEGNVRVFIWDGEAEASIDLDYAHFETLKSAMYRVTPEKHEDEPADLLDAVRDSLREQNRAESQ